MQKWEYAYIHWIPDQPEMTLVYLHPSGQKSPTLDKAKKKDGFDQLYAWVSTLGEEGYEMTGVTGVNRTVVAGTSTVYTFWFKLPIT